MSDSLMPPVDYATTHTESTSAPNTDAPQWYIDEGVPGVGTRPEWLDPKFKTVAEIAKSYSELQKKLGTTEAPPDTYSFGELEVNLDNPHIKDMMIYAKEHRMSQDAFSAMVNGLAGYAESYTPDVNEELQKLGPNGKQRLDELSRWAANTLPPEDYEVFKDVATSSRVVEVFEKIKQNAYRNTPQPPMGANMNAPTPPMTLKEVQAEMTNNLAKYETDPRYRAEITSKFERATK